MRSARAPDGLFNELEVERYLQALIPDRLEVSFKETHEADFAYGFREGQPVSDQRLSATGRVSLRSECCGPIR